MGSKIAIFSQKGPQKGTPCCGHGSRAPQVPQKTSKKYDVLMILGSIFDVFSVVFNKFLEDVWFKFADWWCLWQRGFLRKRKEKQQKMNREMNGKGVRKGSGIVALLGTFCMDQIGHGGGEAEGNWIC